jgi:hypothetical protein
MDNLKESLRDLDAALESLFAFGARKQSDAQTVAELNAEIDSFKPVRTPCEGSAYPWIHRPERIIFGISRATGIRCTCGRIFEGRPWQAKTNQPAPELWSAMQAFKGHIQDLQSEAERREKFQNYLESRTDCADGGAE